MAVLKQYVDGNGYYIRGTITPRGGKRKGKGRSGEQQNVTYHITMRGENRLFAAGVGVDQQIPPRLFHELIRSKDIFTEPGRRNRRTATNMSYPLPAPIAQSATTPSSQPAKPISPQPPVPASASTGGSINDKRLVDPLHTHPLNIPSPKSSASKGHLPPVQLSLASLLSKDQSSVTLPKGRTSIRGRLTRCTKCGRVVAFEQWDKHTCRKDLEQSQDDQARNSDTQQPINSTCIMQAHNNPSKSAEDEPEARTVDFAKLDVICPICHQYVPQTDIEIHMKACNRQQQVRAIRYSLTTHKAQKSLEKQKKRK